MTKDTDIISITPFPAEDAVCPGLSCKTKGKPSHHIVYWGASDEKLRLRCQLCEREWKDIDAYYKVFSPASRPVAAFFYSLAAVIGVWWLPWTYAWKLGMCIAAGAGILQAIYRGFKRRRRYKSYQTMMALSQPIIRTYRSSQSDHTWPKDRRASNKELRQQALALLAHYKNSGHQLVSTLEHDLPLSADVRYKQLAVQVASRTFSENEKNYLEKRLEWLKSLQDKRETWEEILERVPRLLRLVQGEMEDLMITGPSDAPALREDIQELIKEANDYLKQLDTLQLPSFSQAS